MKFLIAVKIAEKNAHLIGKIYKGSTIDEIIVCPTNPEDFNKFCMQYIRLDNEQQVSAPYIDQDVTVAVVLDKYRIKTQSLFTHVVIFNLPDELGVIIE